MQTSLTNKLNVDEGTSTDAAAAAAIAAAAAGAAATTAAGAAAAAAVDEGTSTDVATAAAKCDVEEQHSLCNFQKSMPAQPSLMSAFFAV